MASGLYLPDGIGAPELSVEDRITDLERRMVAAGTALTELVNVLNNHRDVIERQTRVINAHGDLLLQLERNLKQVRRRQKRGGTQASDYEGDGEGERLDPGQGQEAGANQAEADGAEAAGDAEDGDADQGDADEGDTGPAAGADRAAQELRDDEQEGAGAADDPVNVQEEEPVQEAELASQGRKARRRKVNG